MNSTTDVALFHMPSSRKKKLLLQVQLTSARKAHNQWAKNNVWHHNYLQVSLPVKCFLFTCLNRLPLSLARCGQYGQQNCGSLPHSYLIWRSNDFFQWYTLQHLGHGNNSFPVTDDSEFTDELWHASSWNSAERSWYSGCCQRLSLTASNNKTVKSVTPRKACY